MIDAGSVFGSHVEGTALTWLGSLGYAMLSRKVPDELHGQTGENQLKYTT